MSQLLWRLYLEDDADTFCQVLENASVTSRPAAQKPAVSGYGNIKIEQAGGYGRSPAGVASSFNNTLSPQVQVDKTNYRDITISRSDLNRRDGKGMSILHYAASSVNENACALALALITHPAIDLYQQDIENGWTALHRCFYFGNITIARAILEREAQDIVGEGQAGLNSTRTRLIRVKDREGNGPFDLLTETIGDRELLERRGGTDGQASEDGDDEDLPPHGGPEDTLGGQSHPLLDLSGDEVLTFGSNKNISLGLGNEDDRQYPERITLRRPEHLFRRFMRQHFESRAHEDAIASPAYAEKVRLSGKEQFDSSSMPSVIRSTSIKIRDVAMSKFHSAVLTDDPTSNLYVTGHGTGGRLGTGNEQTQFNFVCVDDYGGSRKKIVSVAMGQDHTLAVTDQGELFTWGSNAHGQLGAGLSRTSLNAQEPPQLVPKQLFGPLKKEYIIGVAASRVHSVAHTSTAIYTWGKNDGQLGIIDANAATLEIQPTPKHVAPSRFSHGIQSVSAMEGATVCLLENHEVHVFANYGMVKLSFPLGLTNDFLKNSLRTTRYDKVPNKITKISCGGQTICALASSGEIFAVSVDKRVNPGPSNPTSTTNPNKIRAALSFPALVWSLKKGHMNARDVGVDQDGSIVLTTEAGSVWRRAKRSNLPGRNKSHGQLKDFKFSRIPGLTRVIAVRASGSGAYAAIRRDCHVTREQIEPEQRSLQTDVSQLLPFSNLEPILSKTTKPAATPPASALVAMRVTSALASFADPEGEVQRVLSQAPNTNCSHYDAMIVSTVSDLKIPAHSFLIASRSSILTDAIVTAQRTGSWDCEVLSISIAEQGDIHLVFKGVDSLTLIELVLYIYTDRYVGFWLRSRDALHLAHRYRQIRIEIMRVAARLDLRNLESAARRMVTLEDARERDSMHLDMEVALHHWSFFDAGDIVVQLADGEHLMHSDLASRRCPFFEGLFQGRAGGLWLSGRRTSLQDSAEAISIDFSHVELSTFRLVLRHIYADTGIELFDDIIADDLDTFLDVILDVLSLANELMLHRLSTICQQMLGRYVNIRNVCSLLNAIAPSAITDFKTSALEYICLNLEAMLTNQYLDELEEDLLYELDQVVRDNQLNSFPIAKSGRAEALLLEKYPELAERLDRDRQAKIDALHVQAKYSDGLGTLGISFNANDDDDDTPSRNKPRRTRHAQQEKSPRLTATPRSPRAEVASSLDNTLLRSPTSPLVMSTLVDDQTATDRLALASPDALSDLGPAALSLDLPTPSKSQKQTADLPSPRGARSWDMTPDRTAKLGMKEIMDQASSSRTSGIALGLASQARAEATAVGSFGVRTSQKERRRQISEQQQRQQSSAMASSSPSAETASPAATSPWQTVARAKTSMFSSSPINDTTPTTPLKSSAQNVPATPQLTMRQTVANVVPEKKGKERAQQQPVPQTPPSTQRSVSASQRPNTSGSRSASSSQPTSSAAKPVEIQSIRHTPRPDAQLSPSFFMHQTMADIVAQQEMEKTTVKEAVAKRSLQEIQQEQEFLSWWDAESKRALEEEEAASRAASARGRGGGARRGRRGPSRGRGKKQTSQPDDAT